MKRSLNELIRYAIKANDGLKGTVKDFLFDEESWTIRYLEADLGIVFPGKKVLIPTIFLDNPDWEKAQFPVHLTKEAIKNCPEREAHLSVSRAYEEELNKYYNINAYWPVSKKTMSSPPMFNTSMAVPVPRRLTNEDDLDTNLRSFKEVFGYYLVFNDKNKGYIKDFIIDDETWQLVYIVVDIGHWYSISKEVMLAVSWMDSISYVDQTISINQNSSILKNAPGFDASSPVNVDYEKSIFDHYQKEIGI